MSRFGSLMVLMLLAVGVRAAPLTVDTAWLAAQLDDPRVVVVDMSSDRSQYQRFHLPGAVRLDFQSLVRRTPQGVVLRLEDGGLEARLGELGITPEDHVVAYDDIGGLNAGRLLWELERIGHKNVSVLDGGLVKWIQERRPVDNRPVDRPQTVYPRVTRGFRDNEIALPGVREAIRKGDAVLLDVRTQGEYAGDPRDPRGGHIPGALWWPWDATIDFDGAFDRRDVQELLAGLEGLGVVSKQQPIIVYCRSGHRASQSYYMLRSLGFENVRLYDGSMLDYARDPRPALVRGMAPGSAG